MKRYQQSTRFNSRGLTLVELLVVLVILGGVAGIFIANWGQESQKAAKAATEESMRAIRDAIELTTSSTKSYKDDVGAYPTRVSDLLIKPINVSTYDPSIKRGWKGPYIETRNRVLPSSKYDSSIISSNELLTEGNQVVYDGWANPIVMGTFTPTESGSSDPPTHFWLVSAGPDGEIQTPLDDFNHKASNGNSLRGDDIVLFLKDADPND